MPPPMAFGATAGTAPAGWTPPGVPSADLVGDPSAVPPTALVGRTPDVAPTVGVETLGATCSVRRCTAVAPVRAFVRDPGRDDEPAGTGVTRGTATGNGAASTAADDDCGDGGDGDTTGASGPAAAARTDAEATDGAGAEADADTGPPAGDGAAEPEGGVPPAPARWTEGIRPLGSLTAPGVSGEAGGAVVGAGPPAAAVCHPATRGADPPSPRPAVVARAAPDESEAPRPAVGTATSVGPLRAREKPPAAEPWPTAEPQPLAPGSFGGLTRSGTTGVRCTAGPETANGRVFEGSSRPGTGRADTGCPVPPSIALDCPSRIAWDAVPMNDGFCHVGSRPPNPESVTPTRPGARARWIGGSPDQEAAATARPTPRASPPVGSEASIASDVPASPTNGAVAAVTAPPPLSPLPSARFRNRSRNPIAQPSAPARVTRDAISPV
jgi:hypothetical protein